MTPQPDDELKAACEGLVNKLDQIFRQRHTKEDTIRPVMAFVRQREAAVWRAATDICTELEVSELNKTPDERIGDGSHQTAGELARRCEAQARAREGKR